MTKDEALKKIATVNAMDFEYRAWARQALANDALEKKVENARELGLDYEPEPERFLVATIGNWGRVEWADGVFPSLGNKLYSAPPKWVGLTDEDFYGQSELQVMAMKYAEAKLKEKNT
jgi:hypothetical protein